MMVVEATTRNTPARRGVSLFCYTFIMTPKTKYLAACEGKRKFTSYSQAERFIKNRFKRPHRKRHKPRLKVYRCQFDRHYHIGNTLSYE